MLVVPVDIKGKSCACTSRHSREVINFRLEIPLEIDDGRCLCGSGSAPTIHEVHSPTLIQLGMSVDDGPQKSAPQQDQISPLWLHDNLGLMAESERTNAHMVHTLRGHKIDLVNHTFEALRNDVIIAENNHQRAKSKSGAPLENSAGVACRPSNVLQLSQNINGVLRRNSLTANPFSAVSTCSDNNTLPKLSVTNLLNCIGVTEGVDQRSEALAPQTKVSANKLIVEVIDGTESFGKDTNTILPDTLTNISRPQATEHNDSMTTPNSSEFVGNPKNKRKLSVITDITTPGPTQAKRAKTN